jgi:hypothetical protein
MKKNVHSGHRKRMRELIEKVGFENLNEFKHLNLPWPMYCHARTQMKLLTNF